MRSRKVSPFGEVCEKKRRRTIARECRREAVPSFPLSRSGRRSWRARLALRMHSVARTSTRLVAVRVVAPAPLQAAEATAAGTRRASSAIASATQDLERRIGLGLVPGDTLSDSEFTGTPLDAGPRG